MLIAEIIGASGAGKSTLSDLLNKQSPQIRAGITVWGLPRTLLMQIAISSFPTIARMVSEDGKFSVNDSKQIVRLRAFYRHLIYKKNFLKQTKKSSSGKNVDAMLLDEGVIFSLSKLRADHRSYKGFMQNWEEETLDCWSDVLNMVIWLDAPNEVLIERVRTREKKHRMKFRSDQTINDFLTRYRKAYANIVKRLQAKGNLQVIRFNTEKQTLETIAAQIEEIIKKNKEAQAAQSNSTRNRNLKPKLKDKVVYTIFLCLYQLAAVIIGGSV